MSSASITAFIGCFPVGKRRSYHVSYNAPHSWFGVCWYMLHIRRREGGCAHYTCWPEIFITDENLNGSIAKSASCRGSCALSLFIQKFWHPWALHSGVRPKQVELYFSIIGPISSMSVLDHYWMIFAVGGPGERQSSVNTPLPLLLYRCDSMVRSRQ